MEEGNGEGEKGAEACTFDGLESGGGGGLPLVDAHVELVLQSDHLQ